MILIIATIIGIAIWVLVFSIVYLHNFEKRLEKDYVDAINLFKEDRKEDSKGKLKHMQM